MAYAARPRGAPADPASPLERRVTQCVERAMAWFDAAGMLLDEGHAGIMEGLGTEVYADGTQKVQPTTRTDCAGEASLAFLLHNIPTGNPRSRVVSRRLQDWCFNRMQEFRDVGWGPWAMESGWTVAGTSAGLMMGLLEEKPAPLSRASALPIPARASP